MRFLYSESVSGLCSVYLHLTPDNSGLNWVGLLICGYFSVANTTVGALWLVESEDAEPKDRRAGCTTPFTTRDWSIL